jgi:hypothetical protein
MKKRFHIQAGEPAANGEHEWNVFDRSRSCSHNCYDCSGIVVFTATTRAAARQACAERNAEDEETLMLSAATIAELKATYPTCLHCGAIRMAGSDRVHALFCADDAKKSQRTIRS